MFGLFSNSPEFRGSGTVAALKESKGAMAPHLRLASPLAPPFEFYRHKAQVI